MPHLDRDEIMRIADRYAPTEEKTAALGMFAHQQVKDRFATAGASGGIAWPQKKMREWGYDDGRAILTGRTGELLESFQSYGEVDCAVVFSDKFYSRIQHLGTVGKGGVLPDIKPKKAKALFIPITDRAQASVSVTGVHAAALRQSYGMKPSPSPFRVATHGPKITGGLFAPLRKGRLKDNHLEVWDGEKYVAGVPDFIFLQSVSLPSRPLLPTGEAERAAQVHFYAQVCFED